MAESRAELDRLRVVHSFTELVPSGDWVSAFEDEARLERVHAYFEGVASPELEIEGMVAGRRGLVSAVRGAEGLIAFWREWLSPWESFTLEVERVVEGANGVLLEVVQRGRLEGSAAVVETASGAVFYFSGDHLARIEFHIERTEARKAAGVS